MKVKSILAYFLSIRPGHHRAFNAWHDFDHRPENHGTIPHIFHSQRWVAPPEYVAARGAVGQPALPVGGGQYFATYWSTATPEKLTEDAFLLRDQLQVIGRMAPMQEHLESVWRGQMHFVTAQTREGLSLSADAVPIAPHKGILVSLGGVTNKCAGEEWADWHNRVHVPDLLRCKGFRAFFKFMPMREEDRHIYMHLFYLDEDPLEALADAQRHIDRCRSQGRYPDDLVETSIQPWLTGIYKPIVPGQYEFYD